MFKEVLEDQMARIVGNDGYKQTKEAIKGEQLAGLFKIIDNAATFREDEARAAAEELAQSIAATSVLLLCYRTLAAGMAQCMDAMVDQMGQQAGVPIGEIEKLKAAALAAALRA